MFDKNWKMAIYMENSLNTDYGKMGFGVMRYTEHQVVCVIDSQFKGMTVRQAVNQPFDVPIVGSVMEAAAMDAQIFVLGTAPSGGKFPDTWVAPVEEALQNYRYGCRQNDNRARDLQMVKGSKHQH